MKVLDNKEDFIMKLKDTGLTVQDIKDKVNKYMIETYERFDFLAETAEGMYIYDENGTPYLDFYAGIAVNNAGNRNPKVVAAVKDQVDDIMHTFNYPYTIPQALLAEKVCKTLGMDKIFYQNSGTEANECMIKMVRKYGIEKFGPNRYEIITAKEGFHGRTMGAVAATGVEMVGFCFVMSEAMKAALEATPIDAGSGRMVVENGAIGGYPVFCTEYINYGSSKEKADVEYVAAGCFGYLPTNQHGEVRLIIDPYTQAKKDVVVFTLNSDWSITTLRKEAFALYKTAGA